MWWGVLEEAAAVVRAEIAEEALVLNGDDCRFERLITNYQLFKHTTIKKVHLRIPFSIKHRRWHRVAVCFVAFGKFVERVGHHTRTGDRKENFVALSGVVYF